MKTQENQDNVNRHWQQVIKEAVGVVPDFTIRVGPGIIFIFDELKRRNYQRFAVGEAGKAEQFFQVTNQLAAGCADIVPSDKYPNRDDDT